MRLKGIHKNPLGPGKQFAKNHFPFLECEPVRLHLELLFTGFIHKTSKFSFSSSPDVVLGLHPPRHPHPNLWSRVCGGTDPASSGWGPGSQGQQSHLEVIRNIRGGKGEGQEEVRGRREKGEKKARRWGGDTEQPHLFPNTQMPFFHYDKF